MRIEFSKVRALFIISLLAFMPAFAKDSIISSITISKANDNLNSYELDIDSTEATDYKMSVEDDKSVYFDIKNSVLSEDSATYYNDVTNIDSAIVKQVGKNKVRVYLQGKNVKNTQIVFSNSLTENNNIPLPAKKITINRPMNEYVPTSNIDLEDMDEIQDWNDNSFNIKQFMLSLKDGMLGVVLAFLLVLGVIISSIKTLGKKLIQDSEPLIGLKQHKYNTQNEINNKISQNHMNNMQTTNLESITKRSQALQNAQSELTKAHEKYQQYLQSKYKTAPKKQYSQSSTDYIKKGIAINQYQKSTQNPYKNQEVLRMNSQPTSNYNKERSFQIPSRSGIQTLVKQQQAVQPNTSPYIQRKTNFQERQKPYTKPDNLKFLESVTKIYEQSGRADLADELKNSIAKAKKF